ncbi:hypothetical protein SERLA73DRAFT_184137 [Serpula lacrymans var. lacrymans S7.3]|uniref:Uncharacterized protein n=2 Tax=Serpula lacrymans var. lacrymans TaxID=341189 RepID=F8Q2M0_SERL3|nr:uncharacterized protein SERLADRAFT_471659 [Serpula lacrymans var. lacrymans S7.9]EGN97431.1 hypothetical protein SERLA73DRAFT_184137 [Serpula lacrymans var. lacrymans S7.3]EGO23021.1 hypothetical protein SERLADRAFT_471659 [Serpula lacrymans var. lacrymans S7.9]
MVVRFKIEGQSAVRWLLKGPILRGHEVVSRENSMVEVTVVKLYFSNVVVVFFAASKMKGYGAIV